MTAGLTAWLTQYGYVGLALGVSLESAGLPVPGETALLVAAFAAAHGSLSLPLVMITAAAAGILGDNLGYAVGRRFGRPWLERFGPRVLLFPARLARADAFFARWGGPAIALARFAPGVRVVGALMAGVSGMRWRTFLLFNALGAVAWASIVGLLGYGSGTVWQTVGKLPSGPVATGLVIAATVVLSIALLAGAVRRAPSRDGRWLVWRSTAIVGVSLAAALVLAGVVDSVSEKEIGALDTAARQWILAHRPPMVVGVFTVVSRVGSAISLGALTLIVLVVLWRRGRRASLPAALVPLLSAGVIVALKHAFARVRPPGGALARELTYSFPSGHTAAATAVFITLAMVLHRERLVPVRVPVLAVVAGLLVGLSRVVLDVHWASDVLAGWSVGILVAVVGIALQERLRPQEESAQSITVIR